MQLNADFSQRVLVHSSKQQWLASPMAGVERRMLDRIGDEVARATTIVRYAPGSAFSAHTHSGGEEFVVLEGIFQDEHGDYPAGTYVRNPPTSSHTPGSEAGCTIFVKLWQFDAHDRKQFRKNMYAELGSAEKGVAVLELHRDEREVVTFQALAPEVTLILDAAGGIELLLIEGTVTESEESLIKGSWLRLPEGQRLQVTAGVEGAKLWIKTGHLPFAQAPLV